MCLHHILDSPPLPFSLIHPPLHLRTISVGFIILFSFVNTKYIHNIHPYSPFPYALPLLLVPVPRKGLVLTRPSLFKKYIVIVQGDFALAFDICIYHALIRLTPSIYCITLLPYYLTAYSALLYCIYI
jgi:hypothetical protein